MIPFFINKKKIIKKLFVITILLFLSIAFFSGRVGLSIRQFPFLSGDAANIASFSAAIDYPEFFENDTVLNSISNFAFYQTVHIPLIRVIENYVGNFGSAFLVLTGPVIFLHLIGYYLLGLHLFRDDDFLAFLLSISMGLIQFSFEVDSWALYFDPIPRVLFQALIPFVLVMLLAWGRKLPFWPIIMFCTGLLVYVHPVSSPSWSLAIILSIFYFFKLDDSKRSKLLFLLISILVYLITILPFVVNYFKNTIFGKSVNLYDLETIRILFPNSFDPFSLITRILKRFIESPLITVIFIVIFAGIFFVIKNVSYRKINYRFYLIICWWIGIIIGLIVAILDQFIASQMDRMPLQTDLIRNLRYIIPLLLITFYYVIYEIKNIFLGKLLPPKKRDLYKILELFVLSFFIILLFINSNSIFTKLIKRGINCWGQGKLYCLDEDEKYKKEKWLDILLKVKELVPIGSSMLGSDPNDPPDLAIRYFSLRPLVYSYKDYGLISKTSPDEIEKWQSQHSEMIDIYSKKGDYLLYQKSLVGFANKYGAGYIILRDANLESKINDSNLSLLYTNGSYSLYKLSN